MFFEPISASAAYIYHSALELSPLSSIIRRLYYHQPRTSLPRVIVGNLDLWDRGLAASESGKSIAHPCPLCGGRWLPFDLLFFLNSNTLACKRLITRAFVPGDLPSLIESIFSSKDQEAVVYGLQRDDAQNFIDIVDEVRFKFARLLKNRSTTIGIDAFCQLGTWQA